MNGNAGWYSNGSGRTQLWNGSLWLDAYTSLNEREANQLAREGLSRSGVVRFYRGKKFVSWLLLAALYIFDFGMLSILRMYVPAFGQSLDDTLAAMILLVVFAVPIALIVLLHRYRHRIDFIEFPFGVPRMSGRKKIMLAAGVYFTATAIANETGIIKRTRDSAVQETQMGPGGMSTRYSGYYTKSGKYVKPHWERH